VRQAWQALGILAVDAAGNEVISAAVEQWAFAATMLRPRLTRAEFDLYNSSARGQAELGTFAALFSIGTSQRRAMLATDVDAGGFAPAASVASAPTSYPLKLAPDDGVNRASFNGAPPFDNGKTYLGIIIVVLLMPAFFFVTAHALWRKYLTLEAVERGASVNTQQVTRFELPKLASGSADAPQQQQQQQQHDDQHHQSKDAPPVVPAEMEIEMALQPQGGAAARLNPPRFVLQHGEWRGLIEAKV
jgi:hypothetical protein